MPRTSRRHFLQSTSYLAGLTASRFTPNFLLPTPDASAPLDEFTYSDVSLSSPLHEEQFHNTHTVLMNLNEDSLLKPLRAMSGLPAPGEELGGWYLYDPHYTIQSGDRGFAPACPFGQWISALARAYAIKP